MTHGWPLAAASVAISLVEQPRIEARREFVDALTLERGEQSCAITRLAEDLPLFANILETPPLVDSGPSEAEEALRELNPDDLTPREALDALYRLRTLISD